MFRLDPFLAIRWIWWWLKKTGSRNRNDKWRYCHDNHISHFSILNRVKCQMKIVCPKHVESAVTIAMSWLYRIYSKYWVTLSIYRICAKVWNSPFFCFLMCLKCCCMYGKQCRPWSDATFRGIWSGYTLFAKAYLSNYLGLLRYVQCLTRGWGLFVCPLWLVVTGAMYESNSCGYITPSCILRGFRKE